MNQKYVLVYTAGPYGRTFFEQSTLVDGSIDVSGLDLSSTFFTRGEHLSVSGAKITTRGYDYVCSLDVALTSVQKVKRYEKIIYEVIESLKEQNIGKIEKLLLLDYLKNSLITLLNSFIYQEKLGLENTDKSEEYRQLRENLISEVVTVISGIITLILNRDSNEIDGVNFTSLFLTVDVVIQKLIKYHSEYKLPGFYVSRPEATNPLTIIGAALLCSERYKNVNAVVGVPSGGTEFAITTKVFINRNGNQNVRLFLSPISLHSLKQFSNTTKLFSESGTGSVFQDSFDGLGSVLLCDDNTSTGKTLQLLKDHLVERCPGIKVYCAVAEADIVRSTIDKDSNKRTHVANRDIYTDSVNILPVSRSISPKNDLKEIVEKKKIIRYYKDMEEKSLTTVDKTYARVMSRVNEFGVDYSGIEKENAVSSFHGTFLSNFYVVPVSLRGVTYPTVEHAYQAAKFFDVDWLSVKEEAKNEIQEALRVRGYAEPVSYSNDLFSDTRMTAGNIKIIADILRRYDYVDKDWEDKRIKIMIQLLLQKFGTKEMMDKLKETGDKNLIEGNTWNDTLWGVCDDKGRNILGIILMDIRKNTSVD